MHLFESELQVMNVLWKKGPTSAKDLAAVLQEEVGWKKTTTYTVIKKCVTKGAIHKQEPGYLCLPLVTKEEVQQTESKEVVDKIFDGSINKFFAAFTSKTKLSAEEIHSLEQLINEHKSNETDGEK